MSIHRQHKYFVVGVTNKGKERVIDGSVDMEKAMQIAEAKAGTDIWADTRVVKGINLSNRYRRNKA